MFDNLTIKKYDKITEYANSLFNIYKIISKKSEINSDNRLRAISLIIYKYVLKIAIDNKLDLSIVEDSETINLIPFFEYVAFNNIEFYDFNNIQITDVDINNPLDLERFVLSHIYYITQQN